MIQNYEIHLSCCKHIMIQSYKSDYYFEQKVNIEEYFIFDKKE
jgi:hypothetical protein